MTKINDYLKCAYANKFTLSGYVLAGAYFATKVAESVFGLDPGISDSIMGFGSAAMLLGSAGGRETYLSYKNTKESLLKGEKLNFHTEILYLQNYGSRTGMKLAKKEHEK